MEERIGHYRVHPMASLFPLMEPMALDDLEKSIELYGQSVPIIVQGNVLLDGRNRLAACLNIGKQPVIQEYTGTEDPSRYIYNLNHTRRDLTPQMRVMIEAKAAPMLAEVAKAARQAGNAAGGKAGGRPLAINNIQSNTDSRSTPVKRDVKEMHARSTVGRLAANAGVSQHLARQAITVIEHAPELADDVCHGAVALKDAAKVAEERKPHRQVRRKLSATLERELSSILFVARELRRKFPKNYPEIRKKFEEVVASFEW